MKLSKKLIAALVTMAMVIAQVSVLPFAETGTSNPYASGYDDGAYYFFRVPNTTKEGDALPVNSAGRTYAKATSFGASSYSAVIGMDPETYVYNKNGAVFIEDFDGEKMVEIDIQDGSQGCYTFNLSSNTYYNGSQYYSGNKGLPEGIDPTQVEGWAIRFKKEGSAPATFELRVGYDNPNADSPPEVPCPIYGYMRKLEEYIYIDANTNEKSIIGYGKPDGKGTSYYLDGEYDGWIIIPFSAAFAADGYTDEIKEQMAAWLSTNWNGVTIYTHGTSCSSHSASWSNWDNQKLYVGDSFFLTDIDKFVDVHAAPAAPELEKKYDDSITIVADSKNIYSIAKASDPTNILETNDHGVFTGLEQNTEYTIFAEWKDKHNAYISQRTYLTDLTNPSMDVPKMIEGSLTDYGISVEVIPGLEYSIKGVSEWNETGVFEGLDPGKEYTLVARNKKTLEETAGLIFTTLTLENIYDRGDGSSTMFEVPRDTDLYKPSYINGNFLKNDQGGLNIVEFNGERFIEAIQESGEKANIGVSGQTAWGMTQGVPRNIWLENFWGFGLRVKIDEAPDDLYFYLQMVFDANKAYGDGWTYYLVDMETGTWTKKIKNGQWYLQGFDGWIILPFNSFFKSSTYSYKYMQENFKAFNYYLNGNSSQTSTISWMESGTTFYMGDAVVIEDIEKFIATYAPNTKEPIIPAPRNNVTDESIPAIMANDASGNLVGDGLYSLDKARANIVKITKPNEKSDALHITPGYGLSNIMITNDALNYDVLPTEVSNRISDSLGIAFYLEVPESLDQRVNFGVQLQDDGTEYHNFGSMYSYYTISDGVVKRKYGSLEFKPGFKGYVMLPFLHFDYDSMTSEYNDGLVNTPDTIGYIGLTFDAETYPAIAESYLIVDDFMLYQSESEFQEAIVKIQGGTDATVIDDDKTFQLDNNPDFPRIMANDCTGIEEEDGIYAIDNLYLTLVDIKGTDDSYVDVTIGEGLSTVMFENHATEEELSEEDLITLFASTGISFDVSVPEDALMTVGMDFEILEAETEYFLYDANKFYYTVEDGQVYKVYGYLEFEPGFNGTVIIPFENFYFDEYYSDFYDGMLTYYELIDYFGFYFSTEYYASIADTTISIDNIAFYEEKYEYIDAVWAKQTGNGTIIPNSNQASNNIQVENSPETGDATPYVAVAGILALSAAVVAFARKKKED